MEKKTRVTQSRLFNAPLPPSLFIPFHPSFYIHFHHFSTLFYTRVSPSLYFPLPPSLFRFSIPVFHREEIRDLGAQLYPPRSPINPIGKFVARFVGGALKSFQEIESRREHARSSIRMLKCYLHSTQGDRHDVCVTIDTIVTRHGQRSHP